MRVLKEGKGVIDEAAKSFEEIIHKGWAGQLPSATADIIGDIASNSMHVLPEAKCLLDQQIFGDDDWVAKGEPRWLNEEDYRAVWKMKGIEAPAGILG